MEEIKAVNGYVNFFIKTDAFVKAIIEKIEKEKKEFGKSKVGKENNVMVEFSAPNTNKPMHLGHIRTNLLGDCLCNLFDFQGYKSIRANLVNDRGIPPELAYAIKFPQGGNIFQSVFDQVHSRNIKVVLSLDKQFKSGVQMTLED